ncbi:hypothetical protein ACOMHN_041375 [Nucella lapillus]
MQLSIRTGCHPVQARLPDVPNLVAASPSVTEVDIVTNLQGVVRSLPISEAVPFRCCLLQLIVGLLVGRLETEAMLSNPVCRASSVRGLASKKIIDWKPRLLAKQQEVR